MIHWFLCIRLACIHYDFYYESVSQSVQNRAVAYLYTKQVADLSAQANLASCPQ